MRGKVKWFDVKKGYGFLVSEADGIELFVHHSSIQMQGYKELNQGELVEFDTKQTRKGMQATNVRRIKG